MESHLEDEMPVPIVNSGSKPFQAYSPVIYSVIKRWEKGDKRSPDRKRNPRESPLKNEINIQDLNLQVSKATAQAIDQKPLGIGHGEIDWDEEYEAGMLTTIPASNTLEPTESVPEATTPAESQHEDGGVVSEDENALWMAIHAVEDTRRDFSDIMYFADEMSSIVDFGGNKSILVHRLTDSLLGRLGDTMAHNQYLVEQMVSFEQVKSDFLKELGRNKRRREKLQEGISEANKSRLDLQLVVAESKNQLKNMEEKGLETARLREEDRMASQKNLGVIHEQRKKLADAQTELATLRKALSTAQISSKALSQKNEELLRTRRQTLTVQNGEKPSQIQTILMALSRLRRSNKGSVGRYTTTVESIMITSRSDCLTEFIAVLSFGVLQVMIVSVTYAAGIRTGGLLLLSWFLSLLFGLPEWMDEQE